MTVNFNFFLFFLGELNKAQGTTTGLLARLPICEKGRVGTVRDPSLPDSEISGLKGNDHDPRPNHCQHLDLGPWMDASRTSLLCGMG